MVLLLLNRPLKGWRWGLRLNRCFFWFGNLRRALYLSSCRSECRLGSFFIFLFLSFSLFVFCSYDSIYKIHTFFLGSVDASVSVSDFVQGIGSGHFSLSILVLGFQLFHLVQFFLACGFCFL